MEKTLTFFFFSLAPGISGSCCCFSSRTFPWRTGSLAWAQREPTPYWFPWNSCNCPGCGQSQCGRDFLQKHTEAANVFGFEWKIYTGAGISFSIFTIRLKWQTLWRQRCVKDEPWDWGYLFCGAVIVCNHTLWYNQQQCGCNASCPGGFFTARWQCCNLCAMHFFHIISQ